MPAYEHTRIYDALKQTEYEAAVTFDKFIDNKPCFMKPGFKQPHERTKMERRGHAAYHNKSYSSAFFCPTCGNAVRANLNFLGQRDVICYGNKTTKE